jgi:hypothetical protein
VINKVLPLLFAYGKYKVKQRLVNIALHLMKEVKPENNKIVCSWKADGLDVNLARESQTSIELVNELPA